MGTSERVLAAGRHVLGPGLRLLVAGLACGATAAPAMQPIYTIEGKIAPKSIVHSGDGQFFAQNMMYANTVTVYDRRFRLVKTISASIDLSKYGYPEYKGVRTGAPVEAAFSHGGRYAWVSNYYLSGFPNPGDDACDAAAHHDDSYLYKIDTRTYEIVNVVRVGPVPKFVAVTPDDRFALVTNWCGWDLSVVDTAGNREIQRVPLGRYPRGIAVNPASTTAYVAVMGSYDIAVVDLQNFSVSWIQGIGRGPRHLNIDPDGSHLYVTLNGEGSIAKVETGSGKVVQKVTTGKAPRSMALSADGKYLYVVNYLSNTVSKVRTSDMAVVRTVRTRKHPIGVAVDDATRQVWVSCYQGFIMVFQDGEDLPPKATPSAKRTPRRKG